MNEKNEVYEAEEVEETVGEEEEYEDDESVGCGSAVAALAVGALGGILIHRIYQNQVKPRVASAKQRWTERKALKATPSEDDYEEAEEDDEPVKEAPKKK